MVIGDHALKEGRHGRFILMSSDGFEAAPVVGWYGKLVSIIFIYPLLEVVWDCDVYREVVRWSVLDMCFWCEERLLEVVVNDIGSIICFY